MRDCLGKGSENQLGKMKKQRNQIYEAIKINKFKKKKVKKIRANSNRDKCEQTEKITTSDDKLELAREENYRGRQSFREASLGAGMKTRLRD